MSQAKQPSKRKRRSKAFPILGAAGCRCRWRAPRVVPGGPAVDLIISGNGDGNKVVLGEEEVSDASLATFYVFDKEGNGTSSMLELIGHGCEGCHGCGHGCGGCGHGCGGCGCVSIGVGCGVGWWVGCCGGYGYWCRRRGHRI
jgi:hypothetical protein